MRVTLARAGRARTSVALLLTTLALGAGASSAQAADTPLDVGGPFMRIGVDDFLPDPGETITINITYTEPGGGATQTSATMGFGLSPFSGPPTNLSDLTFIPGSCTGDFTNCSFDPTDTTTPFQADVPVVGTGDTVTGSAQFIVSPDARDHTINYAGYHRAQTSSGEIFTGTVPLGMHVNNVAVTSDLGVGLTAVAQGGLTGRVNYDVAVTNNGPSASSGTITTQLPSQVSSVTSATCSYASSTDRVTCPIGLLADGATTHATFTAQYGLLSIGLGLNATATRTASSPTDPNAANDSASASCVAVTSLLISC